MSSLQDMSSFLFIGMTMTKAKVAQSNAVIYSW